MTRARAAVITVNGVTHGCVDGDTVAILVGEVTGHRIAADGQAADGKRLGVAVARNAEIVPRSQWATTILVPGDELELVTAAQGG